MLFDSHATCLDAMTVDEAINDSAEIAIKKERYAIPMPFPLVQYPMKRRFVPPSRELGEDVTKINYL